MEDKIVLVIYLERKIRLFFKKITYTVHFLFKFFFIKKTLKCKYHHKILDRMGEGSTGFNIKKSLPHQIIFFSFTYITDSCNINTIEELYQFNGIYLNLVSLHRLDTSNPFVGKQYIKILEKGGGKKTYPRKKTYKNI